MNDLELSLLRSDRINLAFFFRADMAGGAVKLWAGAGDFSLTVAEAGEGAGVYLSAGQWGGGLPDVDHLMNGQAQGLTLSLSAVNLETVKAYIADRRQIVDAPAAFGWAVLDHRHRLAGPVRWVLRGKLSQPRVSRRRRDDTVIERMLSVTLISGAYTRRRGEHSYFTAVDQRRRHPTDASCDRVGLYRSETTRLLPN